MGQLWHIASALGLGCFETQSCELGLPPSTQDPARTCAALTKLPYLFLAHLPENLSRGQWGPGSQKMWLGLSKPSLITVLPPTLFAKGGEQGVLSSWEFLRGSSWGEAESQHELFLNPDLPHSATPRVMSLLVALHSPERG